jgi:hypothetical protein
MVRTNRHIPMAFYIQSSEFANFVLVKRPNLFMETLVEYSLHLGNTGLMLKWNRSINTPKMTKGIPKREKSLKRENQH